MATVPPPSERYVEFDEYIDFQLDKARNGIKWTDILAAGAGVAALILGYLVAFVAADHWLFAGGVPTSLRYASLGLVIVASLVWVALRVVWPYVRQVNDLYAARMLEDAEPSLRGSLFGLVDLRRAGREPAEEVRRALEKRAATVLSDVDVDSSLDRRGLLRTSYVLLAVVMIACLYAVATPKRVGPSLVRALIPTSATGVATRTEILEVKPGNVTILAGSQLDVSVTIRGETPERVMLYYSTADRRFADEPIEMRLHDETTREYQAALIGDAGRGLTQNLTYRIEANDDAAGPFAVDVDQPPVATITSITLQPPAYTGLEPAVRDTPPIEAVEGTTVTLAATANRKLKAAKIVFSDDERFLARGEEVPLRIGADGVTLTANWKLAIRSDGTAPTFYRVECRDAADKTNPNPAVFPVAIRPDLPPEVTLFDPSSDLERPANAIIPLVASARDPDFELREVTLRLERQGQELPERTVLWEGARSAVNVRHDWNLAPLGLKPGDVVSFYIQARDNREPEYNRRNTPKLNVTITEPVSQEEVEQQLADDRRRQAEAAQKAAADAAQEPSGDAADTQPMPSEGADESAGEQGEANEKPDSDEGEQPATEPQAGEDGRPAGSKVGNDGENDDVALRELIEHQRKQEEQRQQQDDEQASESQGEGTGSEKTGAGQRSGSQPSGDSEKGGEQQTPGEQSPPENGEPMGASQGDQPGGKGNPQNAGRDPNGTQRREGGDARDGMRNDGQRSDGTDREGTTGEASSTVEERGGPNGKPEPGTGKPEGKTGGEPGGGTGAGERSEGASPETGSQKPGTQGTERPAGEPGGTPGEPMPSQNGTGNETKPSEAGEPSGTAPKPEANADGRNGQAMDRQGTGTGERPREAAAQPGEPMLGEPAPGGETQSGDQRMSDPRAGEQPPGPPQPQPGPGRDGQRSQRPESGETGAGEPNAAGSPSEQPGGSETTGESGGTQSSTGRSPSPREGSPPGGTGQGEQSTQGEQTTGRPTGNQKPSDQPSPSGMGQTGEGQSGEGQSGKGQSGEGQPGKGQSGEGQSGMGQSGEGQSGEGQSGEGQSGEGQSGMGQSGEGQSGEGHGQAGKGSQGQGGASSGSGSQPGGGGAPGSQGSGGGQAGGADVAEQANADYAKQATDLALKKLEDELERGEVDPELLKELGWTEEDMRRFAERLRKNLSAPTGDETPQELAARKEFQHMLDNLRLDGGPAARDAKTGRVKEVGDVGTANPRVPSEYRDAYEAFTRGVAGRRQGDEKKK